MENMSLNTMTFHGMMALKKQFVQLANKKYPDSCSSINQHKHKIHLMCEIAEVMECIPQEFKTIGGYNIPKTEKIGYYADGVLQFELPNPNGVNIREEIADCLHILSMICLYDEVVLDNVYYVLENYDTWNKKDVLNSIYLYSYEPQFVILLPLLVDDTLENFMDDFIKKHYINIERVESAVCMKENMSNTIENSNTKQ